LEKDFEVLDL
jgi:hypothetical protein